jgi:hypothetical protein
MILYNEKKKILVGAMWDWALTAVRERAAMSWAWWSCWCRRALVRGGRTVERNKGRWENQPNRERNGVNVRKRRRG